MRILPLILACAMTSPAWADSAPGDQPAGPAGIIILHDEAGYPATAVEFVSIQWTNNDGGYVVDSAGVKTPFLNDGIGRIIYFDQSFYEEIDHNQYWVDWRAGLQSREFIAPPVDSIRLTSDDVPRLNSESAALQDAITRYPVGQALVQPIIDTIKDDVAKLNSGLVLDNGKWNTPTAANGEAATPIVGEGQHLITFTTRDGRTFKNAQATVSPTGVSVITDDGGALIPFDQMPDDVSAFPKADQAIIKAGQAQARNQAAPSPTSAAAGAPPSAGPTVPTTFWGQAQYYWQWVVKEAETLYGQASTWISSYTSSSSSPASTNAAPAQPHAAAAAPVAGLDSNAVVIIKGDDAEGTGFLAKTTLGPVVFTNLHVVAANPNLRILTTSGEQIETTDLKGASDRDIAMFTIVDKNYSYLNLAPNVEISANSGDPTIIPGNSQGGEVALKTNGKVLAIGPQLVEFDNPIYHGNSGGPVFDVKTGKVIAVVVAAARVSATNEVDKASFANANSAIKGDMRYFGYRIDTVPDWQEYDQNLFLSETLFLKNFHAQSRALDSFINGVGYGNASSSDEGPPSATEYMSNDEVRKISDQYHSMLTDHDKLTALQEVIFSLGATADENYSYVQDTRRFYPFDQDRAKYEVAYRKALKDEIERIRTYVNQQSTDSNNKFGL